jgi:DivIVA domain-containing protein
MTELDAKRPEFTVGLRGYDRAQVDQYLEHLQERVEEAEERAHDAEHEYIFDQHAAIGPRIAEMFALAEAEARELRDRVATEATQLVSEARTAAEAITDAAERSAREAKERTRREHAEMVEELEAERDRIRDEVTELELRQAEAIADLNRLRDVLGEAAGVVGGGRTTTTQALPAGDGETIELPAVAAEAEEY